MQTFQMAILLLFEKSNDLTGQELLDGVGLPAEQLHKQMQSLIDAKLLVESAEEVSCSRKILTKNLRLANPSNKYNFRLSMVTSLPYSI